MEKIVSFLAAVTGVWKRIAAALPLLAGAGSVLLGAGGLLVEISHAPNGGAIFHILQNLTSDPNAGLIMAGLTALGIHSNHASNVAALKAIPPSPPQTPA